jgi:hypothetical protein
VAFTFINNIDHLSCVTLGDDLREIHSV